MDDNTLMSTSEVAEEAEVSETEARDWAADNGVQRIGSSFVWTSQDVEDFFSDLDEAAEAENADEDEDENEDDEDDEI